jgi:hypothetical protein
MAKVEKKEVPVTEVVTTLEQAVRDLEFQRGFDAAAESAIAFAEQLAPGRNGGKRMREHFDALRASKEG